MRIITMIPVLGIACLSGCHPPKQRLPEWTSVSQLESGTPVSVMLTCYSTTLLANGKDQTRVRIAVTDSLSREITSATDSMRVFVTGDGKIATPEGDLLPLRDDTSGLKYADCRLTQGICHLLFIAGTSPGKVRVEARSGRLWPGSHEIHTLPASFIMKVPAPGQLKPTTKPMDRMIGADISFLPQLEDRGEKFYENGQPKDAILMLKEHGFNYIRLRIFVNPEHEKGYSPGKGYCGLAYTLSMAHRVRKAGLKLLLDFHYSDYWADPQQQNKPQAWSDAGFGALEDSVRTYTARVLNTFKRQGILPDMVQVGNEINHGILWPDGHISQPDQLAALLRAAVEGVEAVDPALPVMMHLALGGQNQEAVLWLDNMIARGVRFDLIGVSYYPRWHGTLDDLQFNLHDLAERYHKPLNVAEYSDFKREVHEIVFSLPDNLGTGACIWEPLNFRSGLFDKEGNVTPLFSLYKDLERKYLSAQ